MYTCWYLILTQGLTECDRKTCFPRVQSTVCFNFVVFVKKISTNLTFMSYNTTELLDCMKKKKTFQSFSFITETFPQVSFQSLPLLICVLLEYRQWYHFFPFHFFLSVAMFMFYAKHFVCVSSYLEVTGIFSNKTKLLAARLHRRFEVNINVSMLTMTRWWFVAGIMFKCFTISA